MKKKTKVKVLYLIEGLEEFGKCPELIAETEDGRKFVQEGRYCGGVPVSSWREWKQDEKSR